MGIYFLHKKKIKLLSNNLKNNIYTGITQGAIIFTGQMYYCELKKKMDGFRTYLLETLYL